MIKKLFLLVLLIQPLFSFAQDFSCGFRKPTIHVQKFSSVYEARDVVTQIKKAANWQNVNFTIREQNGINNCFATVMSGRRFIVYDNNFLEALDMETGTKWASISVMAHEVGHHYYDHVLSGSGSSINKELEADYFSGFIMARLGSSIDQAKAAMIEIATEYDTHTHPKKSDRVAAIEQGWRTALGQNKPQKPADTQPSVSQKTDAKSWIHLGNFSSYSLTVELSDDGSKYQSVKIDPQKEFVFMYEIYNYGWMRLRNPRGTEVFKLQHGKNYGVKWNGRKWEVFAN